MQVVLLSMSTNDDNSNDTIQIKATINLNKY